MMTYTQKTCLFRGSAGNVCLDPAAAATGFAVVSIIFDYNSPFSASFINKEATPTLGWLFCAALLSGKFCVTINAYPAHKRGKPYVEGLQNDGTI